MNETAETFETDVLIIGAGIAGCRAAIEAHERGAKVLSVTKGVFGRDCAATWMASQGYQCWGIHAHDTLDLHVHDTLRSGWFLNNQENVYAYLAHAPDNARELLKWGVRFVMKNGQFFPMWQQGCSTPEGRSIFPEGIGAPTPGLVLMFHYQRVFPQQIKARKIPVVEDTFITDLLTKKGKVVGAVGINVRTGEFRVFIAKSTIVATGGYQGVYKIITSSPQLTGDGQAMALRAGVDMMDFEFNQALPCILWPPLLISDGFPYQLIFHWGAHLYNREGERFMSKWDPVKMELATRSTLMRAISHEVKAGRGSPHGGVYCSVTHMPSKFIEEKYEKIKRSRIIERLGQAGVDLKRDYLETGNMIHYCQGGCNVNTKCETDKDGLYAIGEAASGSKDGADRMGSNSLPFCMAMGTIAGAEAAERAKGMSMPELDDSQIQEFEKRMLAPLDRSDGVKVFSVKSQFQELMTEEAVGGRTDKGLNRVLEELERYRKEVVPKLFVSNKNRRFNTEWVNVLEFENLLLLAECIAKNALLRTEGRGAHDRFDYPETDSNWFKNIHLRLVDGKLKQWTTDVEFTYWEPEKGSHGEPWKKGVQVRKYEGWRAKPLYKGA